MKQTDYSISTGVASPTSTSPRFKWRVADFDCKLSRQDFRSFSLVGRLSEKQGIRDYLLKMK
jgi:hypothetical protein